MKNFIFAAVLIFATNLSHATSYSSVDTRRASGLWILKHGNLDCLINLVDSKVSPHAYLIMQKNGCLSKILGKSIGGWNAFDYSIIISDLTNSNNSVTFNGPPIIKKHVFMTLTRPNNRHYMHILKESGKNIDVFTASGRAGR